MGSQILSAAVITKLGAGELWGMERAGHGRVASRLVRMPTPTRPRSLLSLSSALVARQFVAMPRDRLESALRAFPRLLAAGGGVGDLATEPSAADASDDECETAAASGGRGGTADPRTYVEDSSLRYVFHPLGGDDDGGTSVGPDSAGAGWCDGAGGASAPPLYLVLLTPLSSNVVEDLATVRLCASVVLSCRPGGLFRTDGADDNRRDPDAPARTVRRAAFDVLLALDESLGGAGSPGAGVGHATVAGCREALAGDSQEERLHRSLERQKQAEAKREMRRRALEIQQQKRTGGRGGPAAAPGLGVGPLPPPGGPLVPNGPPTGERERAPATTVAERVAAARLARDGPPGAAGVGAAGGAPHRPALGATGGVGAAGSHLADALRAEGEAVASPAVPAAAATPPPPPPLSASAAAALSSAQLGRSPGAPVLARWEERCSYRLGRDGMAAPGSRLCHGTLSILIRDAARAAGGAVTLAAPPGALPAGSQLRGHPAVDRDALKQGWDEGGAIIVRGKGGRPFPAGGPVAVLRWRWDEASAPAAGAGAGPLPLAVSCWPAPPEGGRTSVTLEAECPDEPGAAPAEGCEISALLPLSVRVPNDAVVRSCDGPSRVMPSHAHPGRLSIAWRPKGGRLTPGEQATLEYSVPGALGEDEALGGAPVSIGFASARLIALAPGGGGATCADAQGAPVEVAEARVTQAEGCWANAEAGVPAATTATG